MAKSQGCNGKRKRTEHEAIASAIRLSRNRVPLRPYRCDLCDTWHLTKQPLRGRLDPADLQAERFGHHQELAEERQRRSEP